MAAQEIKVLLAEDDLGDVALIRESLKASKLSIHIDHVVHGQDCLDYLRKSGKYQNAREPDLVLLDLNMPVKDGRQVLKEIKQDMSFKKIPVVILTTSDADADINKSYLLGANCFVTKPIDFDQFQKVMNEIVHFWFTVVKLPDGKD